MSRERFTVAMLAEGLGVLPESIRAAANRARLEKHNEWFFLPTDEQHPQMLLFFKELAKRPANRAEQLLRDLGCRPPRI